MQPRHCIQCGERQTLDARFCPRCGAALPVAAVAADVDPLVGTVVADRYRLLERIGRGASGAIYRAEHTTLKRQLAIKILHPQHSSDAAAVERFRREATTIGQIDNDHLLQISDFGSTVDNRLFFAMELLEGETLDAVLEREVRVAPARAVKILLQVTDALGVAHSHGYIHRDLRPRNVFLAVRRGERDFVKLLDFALAKLAQPQVEMRQTSMGMTFGDPRYMSPEQASGNTLDPRSDVYSLGVVAFQMLTGLVPFDGTGPIEVLQKVLDNPVPQIVSGDTPPWLRAIVERTLQKRPEDRFADMAALAECLSTETAPPALAAASPAVPRPVAESREAATAPVRPAPSRTLIMETALPASVAAAAAVPTPAPAPMPVPVPVVVHEAKVIVPTEIPAPVAPSPSISPATTAEAVAGEVRSPTSTRPAHTESSPSVVIEDGYIPAREEPTGPHRTDGEDGWFRDRSNPGIELPPEELYGDEPPKKARGLGLIGVIAGGLSLAAIGTIALWPRPHAAPKESAGTTSTVTPVVTPVPATPPAQPTTGPTPDAAQASPSATPPSQPTTPTPPPEPVKAPPPEPVKAPPPEPVKAPPPEPVKAPPPVQPKGKPGKPAVASKEPTAKPTRSVAPVPKGFADPFATAVSTELDSLVKNGRQKLAAGDLAQAQAAFTKAKAIDSRSADAFAGLGEVAFELGDYGTATTQLKQAVKLSPNRARFLLLLGQSYYKSGRAKEAVQEYRRALRIDPTNPEAQRSLELAEKKLAQGG